MKITNALIAALIASGSFCKAEIEKTAIASNEGMKLFWWPKVEAPVGFQFDREVSYQATVKMFIQSGFTFSNAETVIYAKAIYKPRDPELKSLQALIERDKAEFRERDSKIQVKAEVPLLDGDGKKLPTMSFVPSEGKGNWEMVAYGEEGDFYLIFTISSRSKAGFDGALSGFKKMLGAYHEKP